MLICGKIFVIAGIFITSLFPSVLLAQGGFPAEELIQDKLQSLVDSGRSIGVVVGILDEDGGTRVFSAGSSGNGLSPLNGDTVFEIGSITKLFTATLLADLVNRGEVQLSSPISTLLPPEILVPSRNNRDITLEDIATHHSGLPRLPTNFDPIDPKNPYADYSVQQLYDFLSDYELTRDPGTSFEYSNLAVGLLGHVLSLRADMSYEELVKTRILSPINMQHTSITLPPPTASNFAIGHNSYGEATSNWDMPTLAAAGAFHSTVNDMLRFAEVSLSSRASDLINALQATQIERRRINNESEGVGLNWFITKRGEVEITWHDGGTGGYRTFIGMDVASRRAVVVFTNSGGMGVNDLGFHLLDATVPLAKPSAGPLIAKTYQSGGIELAMSRYRELFSNERSSYRFGEFVLAELGMWLLGKNLISDAIAILELHVEVNAEATSAYDSLGRALQADGRLEDAKATFEKAVALGESQNDQFLSFYKANLVKVIEQLNE